MPEGTTGSSTSNGYWYDGADPTTLDVLGAVRRHRAAEALMRRRVRDDMDMGDTDAAALRWIIREERAGRDATSAALARELGVSTAAVTKLVGRLVASGYLDRSRHPSDRRVVLLRTRPGAHERLRRTLGPMHERMLQLAVSLTPAERAVVVDFLDRLAGIVVEGGDRTGGGSA